MRDMATTIPPLSRSDVEGAGILLTSVVNSHPPDPFDPFTSLKANQDECFKLSIIFYARCALPADCFQVVLDSQICDPNVTHATLISPGTPLLSVDGTRNAILAEGGPVLYMRKSGNPRMTKFMETLDQIFNLLQHRRLGKCQFCLTKSRTWDRNSLLEFYSLKFSYTELGSVHIYVDWGGEFTTCISVDDKQSIRAFLRNLPTLEQPFYIHPFLYSIDGKSLSGQNGSGFGRDVREAVALLKNKKDAEIGRIEKFIYYSPAETAAEIAEQEAEIRRKEDARKRKESVLEVVKSFSFRKSLKHQQPGNSRSQLLEDQDNVEEPSQMTRSTLICSTPPDYEMPLWINGGQEIDFLAASPPVLDVLSNPKKVDPQYHDWLIFDEEDLDDMPPTQPPGDPTGLSASQILGRRHEMASPLRPASSYQFTRTGPQA